MYLSSTLGFLGHALSAKERLKKQKIKCLNLEYWIKKLPTKVLHNKLPRPTPSSSAGRKKRSSRKEKKRGWAISPFIIFGGRFLWWKYVKTRVLKDICIRRSVSNNLARLCNSCRCGNKNSDFCGCEIYSHGFIIHFYWKMNNNFHFRKWRLINQLLRNSSWEFLII